MVKNRTVKTRQILSDMPPYVPGARRPGAIKLSSNENPLGCSPAALEAIRQAATEAHIYPDGTALALKQALAEQAGLTPEEIILGNGSDEVLTLIAAAYINPGDCVLVGAHTFSQYAFAAKLFDGRVETVDMPDLAFDLERIADRLEEPGGRQVRIVFLCSPNNPTGLTISQDDLKRFLERISSQILVVVDHAYLEFQEDPASCDARQYLKDHSNLIVLQTFSKLHGLAALRVGYGLADPGVIEALNRVRSPFNVNSLGQAAAIAALNDQDFIRTSLETNRQGKALMNALFERHKLAHTSSEGNFVTARFPGEARFYANLLAEGGVTVRPLASFGLPQWLRITIGTPEQIATLEALLKPLLTDTPGVPG
ncbi:histidinol phosphate aminotransferase apoenzyme [Alkalispirochaeta americana]|uniref:Histidinol-phosphate aminotransferase n=1 Tax=Alkalispirochaeta americana TaxID=159291 RepID=A0A1N6WZH0_9SPIO|nr:histidinol-phosphate transaminase [Alkalispirochaeta americana]SIQ95524.1 histidinol phosphate aminotransferase apoenzyme [Alkalispirochaeta americana]